jgi:hypothetical protein
MNKILIMLLYFVACCANSAVDEKKSAKWCDFVSLSGKLKKGKHQHEGNGKWFNIFILELIQPLTVNKGVCDDEEQEAISSVKEVQIKDEEEKLNKLVNKYITLSGTVTKPYNYYDVRDVIIYNPLISNDKESNINCEEFNRSAKEKNSDQSYEFEGLVSGSKRLYFHSAPTESCQLNDLFIVPGDRVKSTINYGKFTFIQYHSQRLGEVVQGWVYTNGLNLQK